MYVADATPLIYLAKAEALDVLDGLDVVTTEGVHREVVVAGKEADAPDARRVERYGVEAVPAPESALHERLAESDGLSAVDAGVLALADDRDATALVDDRRARTVAEVEGIDVRGTAYLLLSAVDRGEKDGDEARAILDEMVDAGWYCSTSFYAKIRDRLDEVS